MYVRTAFVFVWREGGGCRSCRLKTERASWTLGLSRRRQQRSNQRPRETTTQRREAKRRFQDFKTSKPRGTQKSRRFFFFFFYVFAFSHVFTRFHLLTARHHLLSVFSFACSQIRPQNKNTRKKSTRGWAARWACSCVSCLLNTGKQTSERKRRCQPPTVNTYSTANKQKQYTWYHTHEANHSTRSWWWLVALTGRDGTEQTAAAASRPCVLALDRCRRVNVTAGAAAAAVAQRTMLYIIRT